MPKQAQFTFEIDQLYKLLGCEEFKDNELRNPTSSIKQKIQERFEKFLNNYGFSLVAEALEDLKERKIVKTYEMNIKGRGDSRINIMYHWKKEEIWLFLYDEDIDDFLFSQEVPVEDARNFFFVKMLEKIHTMYKIQSEVSRIKYIPAEYFAEGAEQKEMFFYKDEDGVVLGVSKKGAENLLNDKMIIKNLQ